jgi:hypothetical protein
MWQQDHLNNNDQKPNWVGDKIERQNANVESQVEGNPTLSFDSTQA